MLEGVLLSALSGLGAFWALFIFRVRCDETCDQNPVPQARSGAWTDRVDSWHWSAQFVAAALFVGWALVLTPPGDGVVT